MGFVPSDHEAREVRNDIPCNQCGYSLRGLTASALCPECGFAIAHTLRRTLVGADAGFLLALRKCATRLLVLLSGWVGSLGLAVGVLFLAPSWKQMGVFILGSGAFWLMIAYLSCVLTFQQSARKHLEIVPGRDLTSPAVILLLFVCLVAMLTIGPAMFFTLFHLSVPIGIVGAGLGATSAAEQLARYAGRTRLAGVARMSRRFALASIGLFILTIGWIGFLEWVRPFRTAARLDLVYWAVPSMAIFCFFVAHVLGVGLFYGLRRVLGLLLRKDFAHGQTQ